jgi:uncharacterized protein
VSDATQHSTVFWTLAVVAAGCIGFTKAGFGGFGIVAGLLMAQIMPAKESTGTVLPMLIAADVMAIGCYRRHISWKDIRNLLPTTFFGLIVGCFLMSRIPGHLFGHVMGWVIIAMMALLLWQRFDRRVLEQVFNHPVLVWASGLMAGITTMMANAGGPSMSFYLLARRFEKTAFVSTCAWFFFVINLCKIPLSWSLGLISGGSLRLNLILLPAVAAGMAAGRFLMGRTPQQPFEWLVILMATASALRMILS